MEAYLPMAGVELLFGMLVAPLVGLLAYWLDGREDRDEGHSG